MTKKITKERILDELKNKGFLIYLALIIIILNLMWWLPQSKTLNVLTMFALAIIQLFYSYSERNTLHDETFFQRNFSVIMGWILLVIAVINLALKLNEINTALFILFVCFTVLISWIIKHFFIQLWNSKSTIHTIIFYVLFSLFFNYLFAFLYTFTSFSDVNAILFLGDIITNAYDYVVFSFSIFYSASDGYVALGWSKLLSLVHIGASYILHIIVLNNVIQNYVCSKNK